MLLGYHSIAIDVSFEILTNRNYRHPFCLCQLRINWMECIVYLAFSVRKCSICYCKRSYFDSACSLLMCVCFFLSAWSIRRTPQNERKLEQWKSYRVARLQHTQTHFILTCSSGEWKKRLNGFTALTGNYSASHILSLTSLLLFLCMLCWALCTMRYNIVMNHISGYAMLMPSSLGEL